MQSLQCTQYRKPVLTILKNDIYNITKRNTQRKSSRQTRHPSHWMYVAILFFEHECGDTKAFFPLYYSKTRLVYPCDDSSVCVGEINACALFVYKSYFDLELQRLEHVTPTLMHMVSIHTFNSLYIDE